VDVKVRYRSKPIPATIEGDPDDRGGWRVSFLRKIPAPAPGQSAVFYDGEEVLGGGIIDDVFRTDG
jgi:tRNA-specific 2-thiouridylase